VIAYDNVGLPSVGATGGSGPTTLDIEKPDGDRIDTAAVEIASMLKQPSPIGTSMGSFINGWNPGAWVYMGCNDLVP
jgi:hypothetical protein